ncbi:uncharacterized protein LOC124804935 [Schistocerca piceifrons]|uniref:uncharacterized protein LOC124804935 n=1 Tax=Schistocerca piceifrons TaxID=274613 RepID=UPI001F5E746E|nr:uncharacterized protein LOC124804935 [Schistocerca piceifrons]
MLTASAAMVETCLLLPGAVPAEKEVARARGAARCLFGPADPGAAELLLREQLAAERERLLWRFGFRVVAALAAEGVEAGLGAEEELAAKEEAQPLGPAPAPSLRRPRAKPYHRQTTVKDFYRVQKAPADKKLEAVSSRPTEGVCAEADAD